MPKPMTTAIVAPEQWHAAPESYSREQAVAAAMHELAAARKRMPMLRVEHDYRFEGSDGGRSPGCVGCSSFADGIPTLGLLHSRDIRFAMASPAPQAKLAVTPSAWAGPMCPDARSALSGSRPTATWTSGSASTSSCAVSLVLHAHDGLLNWGPIWGPRSDPSCHRALPENRPQL